MPTRDQKHIDSLVAALRKKPDANGGKVGTSKLTDEAVLEKMFSERDNGEKWRGVYRGDFEYYYLSPSEATAALLRKLAFYSGNDPVQMERIIRASGLNRRKFDSRRGGSTWLQDEIDAAIVDTTETYSGNTDEDHHQTTTAPPGFGGGGVAGVSLPVKTVEEFFSEVGEETNWICEGIVAKGNVTDIAGEPKQSGKTTLLVHLIKASLNGEPFLDMPTAKVKWLFATEQGTNFREALEGAGLSERAEGLYILQQKDVRAVLWPDFVRGLARAAVDRGCDALVIDTFAAFSGIVGTEENNSGDIREKMAVVREVAQEYDLAVIVLRHAGKSGKARGSSQFEADADIVLTLKRAEGDQPETVRVLEGNGRFDIIPRRLQIELTEDKGYISHGLDSRTQFKKARNTIMRLLPVGEHAAMPQTTLFENLKGREYAISETTARRALKWMVEKGQIRRKDKPVRFWRPTPDHRQSEPPCELGGELNPKGDAPAESEQGEWVL